MKSNQHLPLKLLWLAVVLLFLLGCSSTGDTGGDDATAAPPPTTNAALPTFAEPGESFNSGITRQGSSLTIIPDRPEGEVTTHIVGPGDSIFVIAEIYGLKPETILWSNYEVLQVNPNFLIDGQVLFILPVDGVYHQWKTGESLISVASQYLVEVEVIIDWPANHLDPYSLDLDNPALEDGTMLVVPGGKREFVDWGPPSISRLNPASAAYYGPGHCGEIYEGAVGTDTFIWPSTSSYMTQYFFYGIHPAVDIGGTSGSAIYATDSGVVVYAGWSNYGYGNLVVIDHGTGWTSAYAHLSSFSVYCGQSVWQGNSIGGMGTTGNSTGVHLHFELTQNGIKVDPLNYVGP